MIPPPTSFPINPPAPNLASFPDAAPLTLTYREAAAPTNLSEKTLYRYAPAKVRVGRAVRFRADVIRKWVAAGFPTPAAAE